MMHAILLSPKTDLLHPREKNDKQVVNNNYPVSHQHQCLLILESIFKSKYEFIQGWFRPTHNVLKKFPLASSQSGIVIKYLVQIYYHRSGNKNICQGVCKFTIISK